MKIKWLLLLFISNYTFSYKNGSNLHQAVTYEQSPGRFGDNLTSYIHAKWIAYKFNLPLLYKPFVYSDKLMLHEQEYLYTNDIEDSFDTILTLGKTLPDTNYKKRILYKVPYFPESKWELKHGISFSNKAWEYFIVDWNDPQFIEELKKTIKPRGPIKPMALPKDRISVAVHVRRGGNHDTPETIPGFPLKFLPDEFYIEHIKKLYFLLKEKPLYLYLFTDDNNPPNIIDTFKAQLRGLDIQFDCRKGGNSDTSNVVEDFFALAQFDCLIHSESNFSLIMSKINDYKVSIYPDSFYKKDGTIIYDHVNYNLKSENPDA